MQAGVAAESVIIRTMAAGTAGRTEGT